MHAIDRLCVDCGETKSAAEFHRPDQVGPTSKCRSCRTASRTAWRQNPNYRAKQAEHRRRATLAKFGLSEDEYEAMLEAQGGGCAMCGGTCSSGRRLAVDHDHSTGQVRGLLCRRCNQALGVYEAIRASAEIYLTACISVGSHSADVGAASPMPPSG